MTSHHFCLIQTSRPVIIIIPFHSSSTHLLLSLCHILVGKMVKFNPLSTLSITPIKLNGTGKKTHYSYLLFPQVSNFSSPFTLSANNFTSYFTAKVEAIRRELPQLPPHSPSFSLTTPSQFPLLVPLHFPDF